MTSRSVLLSSLFLTASLLLGACSKQESAPAAAPAKAAKQPISLDAIAAQAKGFTVGSMMSASPVYVFFDAQCPHCGHLWEASLPLQKKVKFVWIPVGWINASSTAQGAALLTAANPGALMSEHEASLLAKKGGDVKDFADLKGKAVVVTSGTTSEVLLHKLNEEQKMDMRIISAKDHGDCFRTLESGRAVAFMMDDALLAGERAKAKKPDNWEIVGKPQSQEAYGCMLRKDDPEFKKLMDDTIAKAQTSGEAEKWFDKWFKNPIPPKNLNMNFELSDEMKALFKEPNDKALN